MKLLLDTYILLWTIGETNALSEKISYEIKNMNNRILWYTSALQAGISW
jgi:PIN domain nuclease of toxin-antitoxin system